MTIEFTPFDMGTEVGTFDYEVAAAPRIGDVVGGMQITAIRRWDAESLELEADVEYICEDEG
ncbi:MAG: hypothetical protein AAF959_18690 [Cyanobacteria bacterium P01_D01_bin.56]